MSELQESYRKMAQRCFDEDIPVDDRLIAEWIRRNVKFREETLFYIVLGVASELAKMRNKPPIPKYCEGQMTLFEVD
jgi:hypothetical protein